MTAERARALEILFQDYKRYLPTKHPLRDVLVNLGACAILARKETGSDRDRELLDYLEFVTDKYEQLKPLKDMVLKVLED